MAQSSLNPQLHRLLKEFGMDRTWERGEGVWLFDDHGQRFLDFYSQYGAVALGHNAPRVKRAMEEALEQGIPAMIQPYRAPNAVRLADRLAALAPEPIKHCFFANSGAETVEAAIKLVRLSTGRKLIVSISGAYHGKTMGAMALSHHAINAHLLNPFPGGFYQLPFGDVEALEQLLAERGDDIAGIILEPIQGERGVFAFSQNYLQALRAGCDQHGIALIFDEIQTGLGRTGKLFCFEHYQVEPDIILLAKALSGGLVPIGAVLVSEAFWDDIFALSHSSTFANNNVACAVGCAVLDALTEDGIVDNAATMGELLIQGLRAIAADHEDLITEVRGKGLMTAIELRGDANKQGLFAAYMEHQNVLGYCVASVLAETENMLVLPSLNNGMVLRIAPALVVEKVHIERALDSLRAIFANMHTHPNLYLLRKIWKLEGATCSEPAAQPEKPSAVSLPPSLPKEPEANRYAFLIHYTRPEDILITDPYMVDMSQAELDRFFARGSNLPPGVVLETPPIHSALGRIANGHLVALPLLPGEMARRGRQYMEDQITEAVTLAVSTGARVVGLGGFTSVYSRNGNTVAGIADVTTTGNTLTAAMAYAAVMRVLERRGIAIQNLRLGIVGAKGSVSSLCALALARAKPKSIVLIGRPSSGKKHLQETADRLSQLHSCDIRCETNLDQLADCPLILSATSSRLPVLDDAAIASGTIICDVARPPDTKALRARRDITVIDGGLVSLPTTQPFGIGNIQGFPPGIQLACLAETILLTLAGETRDRVGSATLDDFDYIADLAGQHGFLLADPPHDALDHVIGLAQPS